MDLGYKPLYLAINVETGGKCAWWNAKNALQDVVCCIRNKLCVISYFLGAVYIAGIIRRDVMYHKFEHLIYSHVTFMTFRYIETCTAACYGDTNAPVRCTWLIAVSYTGSLFNLILIRCHFLSSRNRINVARYRCGGIALRSEKDSCHIE
jgi:hypothetical protein